MCEDRQSESTAGEGVASTRAHPPSASGRSSRPPSPDPVASDPNLAAGWRTPLASHTESLMDMQIQQASPPPRLGRKRGIDELFGDSTPPPPDKLQRELDQQHKEARKLGRTPASSVQPDVDSQAEGQDIKRHKVLAYRGKASNSAAAPSPEDGHSDDGENTSGRQSSSDSNPS